MSIYRDFDALEVIAPNFKRRLSGVTSTIIQLIPGQRAAGIEIAVFGEGLPDSLPRIRYRDFWRLWITPANGKKRVWHARRNVEMLVGVLMRDLLRMPIKLLFTSASQRKHKRYTKWLISRMNAVIATSNKTGAYLEVPHSVVMHGIDTDRFAPSNDKTNAKADLGLPADKKIIGSFGRIRAQKGTDLFVDAMISALREQPDWVAIIAGRATSEHTDFEKNLKSIIQQAGFENRILFVGEHTDIEHWYQALDLFVAPQRWEGFGLTPLEAMACGVPTVATDVGAFSELIVEERTGHILDNFEAQTMAQSVLGLMADNKKRSQMSKAARSHIEKCFSLDTEVTKLNAIYQAMMAGEI